MRLEINSPTIERSENMPEKFFSIKDLALVFDILRSKMYSNPIQSLVREYMSNARDSHTEAGKSDLPIEVVLPNHIEGSWKVRDFGVGISPERIADVFINFGGSTKREDDNQIGGFGCGSKTGFAYSESFSVITRYDGWKYTYCCFIDETKIGKLAQLSKIATDEGNGTEIIIPVKPSDFRAFIDATEKAARHWKVKPILKGESVSFREPKKTISGDNWFVGAPDNSRYYYGQSSLKVLVGEVEYPLDIASLQNYATTGIDKILNSLSGELFLQFQIADGISLVPSREQLNLNPATQEKICVRLKEVVEAFLNKISEKIEEQEDFQKANLFLWTGLQKVIYDSTRIMGKRNFQWRGLDLFKNNYVQLGCPVHTFTRHSNRKGKDSVYVSEHQILRFSAEKEIVCLNDTGATNFTGKFLKAHFEANPDLQTVQVISPNEKMTLDMLNTQFHLDQMNLVPLSSLTTAKPGPIKTSKPKLTIFKFSGSKFSRSSQLEKEEETKKKVLCLLVKDEPDWRRLVFRGGLMGADQLLGGNNRSLFSDVAFYGVDKNTPAARLKEEFSDATPIEEFLETLIADKEDEIIKAEYCSQNQHGAPYEWEPYLAHLDTLEKELDPTSPFLRKIQTMKRLKSEPRNDALCRIHTSLKAPITPDQLLKFQIENPEFNFEIAEKECGDRYQLLNFVNRYQMNREDENIKHVIEYVQFKDQQTKKEK